ncbi:MAG TPA: SH3 domain-containing protein [Clostridia bacterium]|nr:SH3 domain-containing protein [Clostridia bacterium]
MKMFKKLSALCLVLLATFTLSFATPTISFAKAAGKAPVTVRTTVKKTAAKKAKAKAKMTKAKKAKAKARMTAAKRTAKRTTTKARMTAAKRTAKAKARLTAARRTTAKARLTAARKTLKAGSRAKVTAKALNIRSGPAKTFKKIGTLKKGATVKVVASKSGWKKIQHGTHTGYVSSKYLK